VKKFAKETKYMLMCGHLKARQNHNVNKDNTAMGCEAEFVHLGMTVRNGNCIHEKVTRKLHPGNTRYRELKKNLSPCLLTEN
jgi:hypothetical protein